MTEQEYSKCEKLMEEAIRTAKNSKSDYEAYDRLLKEGKAIDAECKLRIADIESGYAEGINQVLSILGFKHDRMDELTKANNVVVKHFYNTLT